MEDKGIERLLAGRAIIDAYRAEQSKGADTSAGLGDKLRDVGFISGNPVDEFFKFNDDICLAIIKEIPVYGECDFCMGYNGTPQCQVWFGGHACGITKKIPSKEDMYKAILTKIRSGKVSSYYNSQAKRLDHYKRQTDAATGIYWYCTKEHGFYCKPFEVQTITSSFLLTWR